jgi:predicted TIM-barrel fold metal-dependent hydrolase
VPFPSVHPKDPDAAEHLREISDAGFKGIKLHPYYQQFTFDDEELMPIYESMTGNGLILLTHAGFDIAYERYRVVDPRRIRAVHDRFPELTLIASHLGAWQDWELVREHLLGTGVYFDISYSLHILDPAEAREIILGHGVDRILFGSDSPWEAQGPALALLEKLDLPDTDVKAILQDNAARLIG